MRTNNQASYFFISFIVFTLLGSLLHFAYSMFGSNILVGMVSPVNESIWEHLKLIFFPCTAFAILLCLRTNTNFLLCLFFSSTASLISMLLLGTISYTVSSLNPSFIVHLLLYIASMALSFFIMYILYNNLIASKINKALGAALSFILIVAFVAFTIEPPTSKIFKDPVTDSYGIPI